MKIVINEALDNSPQGWEPSEAALWTTWCPGGPWQQTTPPTFVLWKESGCSATFGSPPKKETSYQDTAGELCNTHQREYLKALLREKKK